MRRTALICASLAALAVPAAALAWSHAAGDGVLVVQNGSAPKGTAVVTLTIQGAAIGRIASGKIVIEDDTPADPAKPEVTGFQNYKVNDDGTIQTFTATPGAGSDSTALRFRAVGGTYKITIYGSGVYLVASGYGKYAVAGSPDPSANDGRYSVNGNDPQSLPAAPSKQYTLGIPPSATG